MADKPRGRGRGRGKTSTPPKPPSEETVAMLAGNCVISHYYFCQYTHMDSTLIIGNLNTRSMQSMFGASERLLYLLEIVVREYNSTLRMTCGYLYNRSVCGLSMLYP